MQMTVTIPSKRLATGSIDDQLSIYHQSIF